MQIAVKEGVSGFYRGFGAILLTVIPANMCYFSGYEFGKRISPQNWGLGSDLITATIAQTVAGFAFCPIDIVKQRVQTASSLVAGQQLTALQAAREVWVNQGIRGFYRGYWTMNALWYPWNAIYLTMYEASKRRVYYWHLTGELDGPDRKMDKNGTVLVLHYELLDLHYTYKVYIYLLYVQELLSIICSRHFQFGRSLYVHRRVPPLLL